MPCPFCLSDPDENTGNCATCRHDINPKWLYLPPHKLSPINRLELVIADCRYILNWQADIYQTLSFTNPGGGWSWKTRQTRLEQDTIPFLLEKWMSELSEVPAEPEEQACQHLERGLLAPYHPLLQELRRANDWRNQAFLLSQVRASRTRISELQVEIVRNTWWGLYGSVHQRKKILVKIIAGD